MRPKIRHFFPFRSHMQRVFANLFFILFLFQRKSCPVSDKSFAIGTISEVRLIIIVHLTSLQYLSSRIRLFSYLPLLIYSKCSQDPKGGLYINYRGTWKPCFSRLLFFSNTTALNRFPYPITLPSTSALLNRTN